jgi:hypothetical protein
MQRCEKLFKAMVRIIGNGTLDDDTHTVFCRSDSSYCSLFFANNVQPRFVPNRIAAMAFCGKRSDVQCLHRWKKVIQPGIVKGPWTPTEDEILNLAVEQAGGVSKIRLRKNVSFNLNVQCLFFSAHITLISDRLC